MAEKKEHLQKLYSLVKKVANEPGNDWFKEELDSNFGSSLGIVLNETESSIKKIFEHCIKEIIEKQAHDFYKDFRIIEIKEKLISDFIRMEQFRREDNFEDFSLSLFQQLEGIVNFLTEKHNGFRLAILKSKNEPVYKILNKQTMLYDQFDLSNLILPKSPPKNDTPESIEKENKYYLKNVENLFQKDIYNWDYTQKLRAVIYYFVFGQKIYNYFDFKTFFDIGKDIHQARNLNHRGGFLYPNQIDTLNRIDNSKHKYYFKFLGYLETLTSKINDKI